MSVARAGLGAVVCACVASLGVASAGAQSASNAAAAGMRVYVDPGSGSLRDAPSADGKESARAAAAASTSAAGLREVAGPTDAHGVSVDLQGRFRSAMGLRIEAHGRAVTSCDTAAKDTAR